MAAWEDLCQGSSDYEGVLHILTGFQYRFRHLVRMTRKKEKIAQIPCPTLSSSKTCNGVMDDSRL